MTHGWGARHNPQVGREGRYDPWVGWGGRCDLQGVEKKARLVGEVDRVRWVRWDGEQV